MEVARHTIELVNAFGLVGTRAIANIRKTNKRNWQVRFLVATPWKIGLFLLTDCAQPEPRSAAFLCFTSKYLFDLRKHISVPRLRLASTSFCPFSAAIKAFFLYQQMNKEIGGIINSTRSLGALRAPTSSWRPFGPLDFVLRALRALRPCDPRVGDWIVC